MLHPVDKGGKIRTYQMLKELKKNHHITYLTLDDGTAEPDAAEKAREYAHGIITIPHRTPKKFSAGFYFDLAKNLTSKLPYALQKYESTEMRERIKDIANPNDFDVVVCDFLFPAINLPERLNAATVLFQHNVEAMIWRRHYEVATRGPKKTYLKKQWRRMVDYEKKSCRNFDHVVAVSKEDAETMRRNYVITNVSDIPTGVDTDYFVPGKGVEKNEFKLVFTGSMDWLPNDDAMRWFTDEILPVIRKQIPQVSLTVVGRDPSAGLIDLSKRDASISVTGRVADVRPFMETASVYIVPIRIGGGTRLKIYEAMAMELSVVSTTIGAEGLPVKDGEDILVRDIPQDFADAVVKLLQDKNLARQIGERSARTVREKFGWQTVSESFVESCESAIEIWQAKRKNTQ